MNSYFGTCTTEGPTAIKEVILSQVWPEGGESESFLISVFFSYENTADSPRIQLKNPDRTNVGTATDISLFNAGGGSAGIGEAKSWPSGTMVTFIHTGTAYYITNYHNYLMADALTGYVNADNFKTIAEDNLLSGDASTTSNTYNPINNNTYLMTVSNVNNTFYKRKASNIIEYVHQSARVGCNNEYASGDTDRWFCFATTTIDSNESNHIDKHIVFHVTDRFTNARSGILNARARSDYDETTEISTLNVFLDWEYINNYDPNDFKIITNGNLDDTFRPGKGGIATIELWTRVTDSYVPRIFTVISQGERYYDPNHNSDANTYRHYIEDCWTLQENFKYSKNLRFSSPEVGFWSFVNEAAITGDLTAKFSSCLNLTTAGLACNGNITANSATFAHVLTQQSATSTSHSSLYCRGVNSTSGHNPDIYFWARNFNGGAETYHVGIWGHDISGNSFGILDATNSSDIRFYGQSDYITDYHDPTKKVSATYHFNATEFPEDVTVTNWVAMYRRLNNNEARIIPVTVNDLKSKIITNNWGGGFQLIGFTQRARAYDPSKESPIDATLAGRNIAFLARDDGIAVTAYYEHPTDTNQNRWDTLFQVYVHRVNGEWRLHVDHKDGNGNTLLNGYIPITSIST